MKARLLSIVLVLAMVVSVTPFALADGADASGAEDDPGIEIQSPADTEQQAEETQDTLSSTMPDPENGVITLTNNVTLDSSWEVEVEETVTLDLNGFTLDGGTNTAIVNKGMLIIKDSSENGSGKVTGKRGVDNYGSLTLDGGTIQGTSTTDGWSGSVFIYTDDTSFTMNGGTILDGPKSSIDFNPNANTGTNPFDNTKIMILGGSLGTIALKGTAAELTIGSADSENEDIQIDSITTPAGNKSYTINLNGGIIGSLPANGNVTYTGFDSLIEDTTNYPGGYHFESAGDGVYKLVENTDPVAKIGDTSYYYLPDAVKVLTDSNTLTLLADYSITNQSEALVIEAANVTIDLNGNDITVTGDVSNPPITCRAKTGTFKIANFGSEAATITPVTDKTYTVPAVQVSSGSAATVEVDTNVTLTNGIRLSGGRIADTEANRALVAADGNYDGLCTVTFGNARAAGDYIYAFGNLDAIVKQTGEGVTSATVTLLGNADTSINYSTSQIAMKVDLADYTVTASSGNSLISIPDGADGTTLTVKNGTINAQSISAASVLSESCTLTLEDLVMTSGGDFGIATNGSATGSNGSSAGLELTLTDCSLQNTTDSESGTVGIYFPVHNGTLTINNSQITQFDMGVQAISGSATITGEQTEITGSGRVIENESGDGPRFDGAALSVLDREGYGDLGTVKIEAGSFSTPDDPAYGAIHVSGFKDEQFTDDFNNGTGDTQTVQISGGTYSAPVAPELCAAGQAPLVKADGTCSIITPTESGSQGYIEQDGTYYENEDAVATTHVAKVGDKYYSALTEAISAAQNGETVTLLKSTTGNTSVSISDGRSITLDLNGFDAGFSFKHNISVLHGGLNITGSGKLYEELPWFAPVMLYGSDDPTDSNYTTVTVGEDVTLEGWAGLFIDLHNEHPDNAYGITATVYGTLKSVKDISGAGGHALYINGTIKATEGNVPRITLNGATLTTELGNGIYLAGYAETTIIDSSITSTGEDSTGIEIRAGKLSISGDTRIEASTGDVEVTPNGNGSTTANVAIAIAQHTTKLPIEVTVTGGTFIGGAALNEMNPEKNESAAIDLVEIFVEGGNYVGIVNSEDVDGFISGGNFSESVTREYLIDTLNAELKKSIGNTPYSYYTDVDEALKHAQSGDQITDLSGNDGDPAEPVTVCTLTYINGTFTWSQKILSGSEIQLPDLKAQGYHYFRGWTDGNNNFYIGGQTITVTVDLTLTAQWAYIPPVVPTGPSYAITVPAVANGTIVVSGSATEGSNVTITVRPDEGYELAELAVYDEDGNELRLTSAGTNRYSFVMPDGEVTVYAEFRLIEEEEEEVTVPFTDVSEGSWYYDAVAYVYENGLMNGVGDNEFDPQGTATRAMLATILWRLEGKPVVNYLMTYDDVDPASWYGEAVRWATSEGVVTGYGDEAFGPGDAITREQLAVMLYRYAGEPDADRSVLAHFGDSIKVSGWATDAMAWAVENGIVEGDGSNLDPQSNATRAQIAAILMRFIENEAK